MNSAGRLACTKCPAGIVISSQRGISPAMSRSLSWLIWLSGPPATMSVGAVIAARPSRHACGGSLACGTIVVTAQSNDSGPSGREGARGGRDHGGAGSSSTRRVTRPGYRLASR